MLTEGESLLHIHLSIIIIDDCVKQIEIGNCKGDDKAFVDSFESEAFN